MTPRDSSDSCRFFLTSSSRKPGSWSKEEENAGSGKGEGRKTKENRGRHTSEGAKETRK